jgi:putative peptidoglycan lipid II flippase
LLGVFAVSIGTVILPDLSGLAKKQDWKAFYDMLALSVKIIAVITIPVTFFALVCGESIITVVYRGRSFTAESVALTRDVFLCHIAGLFFIACNRILSPAFYARGDTKRPTIAGVASFAVNIALACILVGPFGGTGIAVSLSIASAVNTVLLVLFLRNFNHRAHGGHREEGAQNSVLSVSSVVYLMRIILFSLIAAAVLYFLQPVLLKTFAFFPPRLQHGAALVAGTVVFAGVGVGLLIASKDEVLRKIRRKRY